MGEAIGSLSGLVPQLAGHMSCVAWPETRRAAAGRVGLAGPEPKARAILRFEVLGRMAGGMAHDFCNSLMPIMSYAELLRGRLGADDPLRRYADLIVQSAARAAALPQWLLALGRSYADGPVALDLNQAVGTMSRVLRRAIGDDIELVTATDAQPGRVEADPGQIELALVALALEAREAIPAGGTITISTTHLTPEAAAPELSPGMPEGHYVRLEVSTTGAVSGRGASSRIPGSYQRGALTAGSGLGADPIESMVRQAGGCMRAGSAPGGGAALRILLPSVPETPDEGAGGDGGSPEGGGETVLLVDDDDDVRLCVADALWALGYTVLQAPDAPGALQLEQEHTGRIHLLLTDVFMPGMNGGELAERLAELRPDTKVLYMSGHAASDLSRQGVLDPGVELLRKPFTPVVLRRKIRQVLAAPADQR